MRRLAALSLMFAAAATAGPPPRLSEHTSDAGRFRAVFPHPPEIKTADQASAAGPVRVTTERAEAGKDLMLAVTYADYPEAFEAVSAKAVLDGVREGLKGADGRVVTDDPITLGPAATGLVGRDIRVDAGRNVVRCRAYLDGKRLYQVMATGPKDAVTGKTAEAFFASFAVVK